MAVLLVVDPEVYSITARVSPVSGLCIRRYPTDGERCLFLGAGGDRLRRKLLALTLLVARVTADNHDHAVAADHFAAIADGLHARLNLHRFPLRCCNL